MTPFAQRRSLTVAPWMFCVLFMQTLMLHGECFANELTPLDRYRLGRAREAAVKKQDLQAITKVLEAVDEIRATSDLPAARIEQLRRLLGELEERLGLEKTISASASSEAAIAVPRRELLNVPFAEANAHLQTLDVYAPIQGDKHPVIVWVHGGGMKGGDKAHPGILILKPDFFLSRGFVFASINYRLAPEQKHPAQAEDAAAAIAWLHQHADEYGGDAERIFLIGISAGGQLAGVVSTNERFLASHRLPLSTIRGTVILDIGSFDIPALADAAGDRLPEMYRYTFAEATRRSDWRDCSPMHHVTPGKGVPPMLLCYVAGREHHAQENRRFAERLQAAGYAARLFEAQEKNHTTIELEIGLPGDAVTAEILSFLEPLRQREHDVTTIP